MDQIAPEGGKRKFPKRLKAISFLVLLVVFVVLGVEFFRYLKQEKTPETAIPVNNSQKDFAAQYTPFNLEEMVKLDRGTLAEGESNEPGKTLRGKVLSADDEKVIIIADDGTEKIVFFSQDQGYYIKYLSPTNQSGSPLSSSPAENFEKDDEIVIALYDYEESAETINIIDGIVTLIKK